MLSFYISSSVLPFPSVFMGFTLPGSSAASGLATGSLEVTLCFFSSWFFSSSLTKLSNFDLSVSSSGLLVKRNVMVVCPVVCLIILGGPKLRFSSHWLFLGIQSLETSLGNSFFFAALVLQSLPLVF